MFTNPEVTLMPWFTNPVEATVWLLVRFAIMLFSTVMSLAPLVLNMPYMLCVVELELVPKLMLLAVLRLPIILLLMLRLTGLDPPVKNMPLNPFACEVVVVLVMENEPMRLPVIVTNPPVTNDIP